MTVENTNLDHKRVCFACGSDSTYTWNESHYWFVNRDINTNSIIGFLCRRCYAKIIERPNRDKEKVQFQNTKRMKFKNRIVFLRRPLRIGVCNLCRAVLGEINTQLDKKCNATHIHHEAYDDNNPIKFTIEVCQSCHISVRNDRWLQIRKLEVLLLKLNEIPE